MRLKGTPLFVGCNEEVSFWHGCLYYRKGSEVIMSVLQKSAWKRIASYSRLMERLLRLTPRASVRLDESLFLIAYDGSVYRWNVSNNELVKEHSFRPEMHNPLSFTKIIGVDGFENSVVYGEYFMNPTKRPVAIWQRNSSGQWKSVFEFKGEITHIHTIVSDSCDNCVYILTGDFGDEAAIWKTTNNFQDVVPVVKGEQSFRGCVAFVTEEGLLYATDTPMESNSLFLLKKSGELDKLFDMPGPCIYGAEKDGVYFFSTSVEPDSSLPTWRYFLSNKIGPGLQDNYSHVIAGSPFKGFRETHRFRKDSLPYTLFQFGNVLFPESDVPHTVYLHPISVRHYDGQTIDFKIE